ncbi:unnamed protein product [marine sediment metagenome]|uniref:Uncharacterized protein n=1 Tax=marine sediment metagenome TaxID=412755 RepID=X0TAW1_9ZZZZ
MKSTFIILFLIIPIQSQLWLWFDSKHSSEKETYYQKVERWIQVYNRLDENEKKVQQLQQSWEKQKETISTLTHIFLNQTYQIYQLNQKLTDLTNKKEEQEANDWFANLGY